jgi:hypothetical protein
MAAVALARRRRRCQAADAVRSPSACCGEASSVGRASQGYTSPSLMARNILRTDSSLAMRSFATAKCRPTGRCCGKAATNLGSRVSANYDVQFGERRNNQDWFLIQFPKRRHTSAFSRHDAPELSMNIRPKESRAQETPGARGTRGPCAKVGSTRSSPQAHRTPRRFLRNGFNGLFRALPGDEFVLSPSPTD